MAKPDPHEPPPPLKDPAEGKPPAVVAKPLVAPGGATYQGGDPTWVNDSMPTIGDEQRARSAKIEEMGMDAYMKSGETPPSSDEQARIAQVQGHTPAADHLPPSHPEHEAAKHKSSR